MFGATNQTIDECWDRGLLGLPRGNMHLLDKIDPDRTRLFLFNYSTRQLHGVYVLRCKPINLTEREREREMGK